ncbi:MAG TPA: glycine--tRNA ligase subunit beta [Candidatus Cloacimonas sp.]|nr:glycine--tRNA ligase subunit beta [Candidatus Cloacimonas sp.]HNS84284.1 glycine--tRNA ligase subunit beta [Candidatus Cloacimonas sp.]HPX09607.1 glycine--tRNA ligase subunit beta [Candidatus Cloacimonas sp.]
MEQSRFLLELGCEELPEKQIEIACNSISSFFGTFLKSNKLHCSSYKVSGTPRRIYLEALELDSHQKDEEILKTGPLVNIAYDEEGNLTPAGKGFLKRSQVKEEAIFIQETEKGKFLAVKYIKKGLATVELLKDWITEMIVQIPFEKKMAWSQLGLTFSRPLRWFLVLWDNLPLELDFGGIPCGNITYGNRFLGLDKAITINKAEDYIPKLREQKVIADIEERRKEIINQLAAIFPEGDFKVIEDRELVETVVNLVEFPTAVIGEFEEKYLSLPDKIIISTISQTQKYFAVQNNEGKLSNKFIFISNGNPSASKIIRKGNEKVVKARLADALWYWNEDTKHPLEYWTKYLDKVIFQAKLGTMSDKTKRIMQLVNAVTDELNITEEQKKKAIRCAKLCKADLVTNMLGEKEFTKLQGYIGKQYALASGEDSEIAEGIFEHYLPRGSGDKLPSTMCGAIVAIADKMDTVAGIIGIGMMPTGSGDPFALRRAANGIVQIISYRKWDLDLFTLANKALTLIEKQTELDKKANQNVHNFLEQRIEGLLKTNGIAYDVIDSVMHIDKSHIHDLENRAKALNALKGKEDFIHLVIGFKRVANIIAETKDFVTFNKEKLVEQEEINLYEALQTLHQDIDAALQNKDYPLALQYLIKFGKVIDAFFDRVLVNCEDDELRNNRHSLLKEVKKEFLRVADLSLIVLETG